MLRGGCTKKDLLRVLVLCCALSSGVAHAQIQVDLGAADSLALDQPRTTFIEFRDPTGAMNLFGPSQDLICLGCGFALDTGANGMLIGMLGHLDESTFIFDPNLYPIQQRTDAGAIAMFGTNVTYVEQGVAGFAELNVIVESKVNIADSTLALNTFGNYRPLGAFNLDLGSFGGIAGMPVMVGRKVVLDLARMTPLDFIGVEFVMSEPAPADPTNSYKINLQQLAPAFSGQVHPLDPLPSFAPLPLVPDVTAVLGAKSAGGLFLLDSGSQLTMITSEIANALMINLETDVIDILPVGGLGGTINMPLVQIDELRLLATRVSDSMSAELILRDMVVGVLDIEGLPVAGILGMNALTSGYFQHLLSGMPDDPTKDGMFTQVVLDFMSDPWMMRLDVNPSYVPLESAPDLFGADDGLLEDRVLLASDPGWFWPLQSTIPEPGTAVIFALLGGLCANSRRWKLAVNRQSSIAN